MGASRWRLGAAVLAVAASYAAVKSGRAETADRPVRDALAPVHHPVADKVVGVATDLGSVYALTGLSVTLAATGRVRLAVDVAAAGAAAWVGAQATKPLVERQRPYECAHADRLVAPPAGTSWPSGHAALATAAAATLAEEFGPVGKAVLAGKVAAIGVSRCYVGVHHASDVVAGVGVGAVSGQIGRALVRTVARAVTARRA